MYRWDDQNLRQNLRRARWSLETELELTSSEAARELSACALVDVAAQCCELRDHLRPRVAVQTAGREGRGQRSPHSRGARVPVPVPPA